MGSGTFDLVLVASLTWAKRKKGTVTPGAAYSHAMPGKSSKAFDEDTAVFMTMSQEFREEGNKLFQKKDHEGAMLKYEKALKLLPNNHIDVAHLRTNMVTCYKWHLYAIFISIVFQF
ncbi:hypothetical protein JHK87_014461 [Glycine soja]|nr:hypothetical protein JHK87_014461 [Glycine soja]